MKNLIFLFFGSLLFLGCEQIIPLGDKDIASIKILDTQLEILYLEFNLTPGINSIEVVNIIYDEEIDVTVSHQSGQVFSVRLRRGRDRGAHTSYGINFGTNERFTIRYRRMSWSDHKSVVIVLQRDSSGSLQVQVVTDST